MAKTLSLESKDLEPSKSRLQSATRPRGVVPSDELVPMQFKMPPEFVRQFKIEAATRGMKLNELLKASFIALKKTPS